MSTSGQTRVVEACLGQQLLHALSGSRTAQLGDQYPPLSAIRRKESLSESVRIEETKPDTVLYLAYGSNLCDETFLGKRGIRPLSSINVVVPDLRLTFDLPGLPYTEPCFANSATRSHKGTTLTSYGARTAQVEQHHNDYHKDRWTKGLVGVVYEVTKADYRTIIATEGGGASYNDILIDCYPLSSDQHELVPEYPTSESFKAHTLFAPADPTQAPTAQMDAPLRRPDPSYAQASARYLKLITDGAKQRKLPFEYQRYVDDIRPYTITTPQQRIGMFVFMSLWGPFLTLVFALSKAFAGKDGRSPPWVVWISAAVFRGVWVSYDGLFKPIFGDGERTMGQDESRLTMYSNEKPGHSPNLRAPLLADTTKLPV
ncbi:hypothetical protein CAC42_3052 [Sphaceloma murrayae]|uniref:gamma-glutamylcyclotransferase n=1 Tax=Sphaceloma murrayae TaxID=2082308 RepID=A0A2K1QRE0_9PEZI|nr:hypothetical protein CAC42_3052 [Sphaceloma murrayae]